jgi:hypothetical protein
MGADVEAWKIGDVGGLGSGVVLLFALFPLVDDVGHFDREASIRIGAGRHHHQLTVYGVLSVGSGAIRRPRHRHPVRPAGSARIPRRFRSGVYLVSFASVVHTNEQSELLGATRERQMSHLEHFARARQDLRFHEDYPAAPRRRDRPGVASVLLKLRNRLAFRRTPAVVSRPAYEAIGTGGGEQP